MSSSRRLLLILLTAALAACANDPTSRIKANQATFDRYAPPAQEKIRAGQADIGFTPDMVRMALGEPDRVYTRTTAAGSSEVWAWTGSTPSFSIGVGGGGGAVGAGLGVTTAGDQNEDKLRVIFSNGVVVSIEKTVK